MIQYDGFRLKRLWPLLFIPALAGCQGAYLYSSSLESKTTALNADLGKVHVDAVFAQQAKILSDFGADESAEVTAFTTVLRDQTITSLIRPEPLDSSELSAATRLSRFVNGDLRKIYGTDALDQAKLEELSVLGMRRSLSLEKLNFLTEQYDGAIREYRSNRPADDTRPVACDDLAVPSRAIPLTVHDERYDGIRMLCRELEEFTDPIAANAGFTPDSRLGSDMKRVEMLRASVKEGESQVRSIQAQVDALKQATKVKSGQDELAKQIAGLRKKLEDAIPLAKAAGLEAIDEVLQTALANELMV